MKYFRPLAIVAILFLFCNCKKDDDNKYSDPSSIEIGAYTFNFQTKFVLEERQGIDSYIGDVKGSGISLSFDYGWYTSPASNLPSNEYMVIEDEINGHYRQIVKPIDSESNYTSIHLFKMSDSINSPGGYNSLTMSTNNLSTNEQDIIIEVFNNVEITD